MAIPTTAVTHIKVNNRDYSDPLGMLWDAWQHRTTVTKTVAGVEFTSVDTGVTAVLLGAVGYSASALQGKITKIYLRYDSGDDTPDPYTNDIVISMTLNPYSPGMQNYWDAGTVSQALELSFKDRETIADAMRLTNNGIHVVGGAGGDELHGSQRNDIIKGYGSDDTFVGYEGSDSIDGGSGRDLVSYNYASEHGVTVSLTTGVAKTFTSTATEQDKLLSIEDIDGSDFNDSITGNGGKNSLNGGLGNDRLDGRSGIDSLGGGGGNDTLLGGAGSDKLFGEAGNDKLTGGKGADRLSGGDGNDRYAYSARNEGGDKVMDWNEGDKFIFKQATFGNIAKGALPDANFFSLTSGGTLPNGNTPLFYYSEATHLLWFDLDGHGTEAAIKIADMTATGRAVVAGDILIV